MIDFISGFFLEFQNSQHQDKYDLLSKYISKFKSVLNLMMFFLTFENQSKIMEK